jgi:hypothetical protein
MPNPNQARDEEVARLLRHFFDMFCDAENVPAAMRPAVVPSYFLGWLDSHVALHDKFTVCHDLSIDADIWDFVVHELLPNAAGVEMIAGIWPHITMSDRPPSQHRLRSLHLISLYTWDDGVIFPMSINITQEMVQQTQPFNDAIIGTVLTTRCREFIEVLIRYGLDGMHDMGRHYGGDQPFEIMMGCLLKIIPQLKPEWQASVRDYMRLCQALIRPPIPPELVAMLKAKQQQGDQPGPIVGGWGG